MDAIDVLLGLANEEGEDPRATAAALRGQRDLGQFLGLSTIDPVARMGQSNIRQATQAANRGGVLREAMARRAQREAEQAQAQENWQQDYERGAMESDRNYGLQQARLAQARISASSNPSDVKWYAPRHVKTAKGNELILRSNTLGETDITDVLGRPASQELIDELAGESLQQAGKEEYTEGTVGRIVKDDLPKLVEDANAARRQVSIFNDAMTALESGAQPGVIAEMLPTLRESTRQLQDAQQRAGLVQLGEYTLGSLSEAEGRWLRETAILLSQSPEALMDELPRRIEGMTRVAQANSAAVDFIENSLQAGTVPTQKQIREVRAPFIEGYDFSRKGKTEKALTGKKNVDKYIQMLD